VALHEIVSQENSKEVLAKVVLEISSQFGLPSTPSGESLIDSAFHHHFGQPGKQTRSSLALEASHKMGLSQTVSLSLAACIEALHNASLVQDDYQDSALKRRGFASVHSLFGRDVALGLTLRLVSTAFACLKGIGDARTNSLLIQRIHESVGETVLGQTRDLNPNENRSVESLLSIAKQKSGPLFALSLELPLIAAGFHQSAESAHEAACRFGLGYQIIDDLKDRKIDRLQPNDANIANALADRFGSNDGISQARALAEKELRTAIDLARTLPSESGRLLCTMAAELLAKIEASCG
jgi:geranylgeranyl diphosphate synthase type II